MSVYKNKLELYGDAFLCVFVLMGLASFTEGINPDADLHTLNGMMFGLAVLSFLLGPVIRFMGVLKNSTLKKICMWGVMIGVYAVAVMIIGIENMDFDETRLIMGGGLICFLIVYLIIKFIYQRKKRKEEIEGYHVDGVRSESDTVENDGDS